jgi:hypothetical protein
MDYKIKSQYEDSEGDENVREMNNSRGGGDNNFNNSGMDMRPDRWRGGETGYQNTGGSDNEVIMNFNFLDARRNEPTSLSKNR